MRAFRRGIIFTGILVLLFAGLSAAVNQVVRLWPDMIQSRNKSIVGIQNEPENTIDILVLGDSESYTSVAPMDLWKNHGITTYVCGQSGQRIQETYFMLKTALENQSPKIVALETNVLFRQQTGAKGIQEGVIQTGNYYFPIFRFHDIWKPLLFGKQYAETSFKGFALRDTIESYKGGEYMKHTKNVAVISEQVKDYMEEIINLCKEHNVPLFLYSAPSPVNYNYSKHNAIEAYAKEKGLAYLDLNLKTEELKIEWKTDTFDKGDHLNLAGARKVTDYLGKYWKEHYDLNDHRGDKTYADWENSAGEFAGKMEKSLQRILKMV